MQRVVFLVFFLLSFTPFFWYIHNSQYPFFGNADFISPLDINSLMYSQLFVYNPNAFGGINISYLSAHFMPEYLFFAFFSFFHLSPAIISLLFIGLIIFISEVSMYFFLKKVLLDHLQFKGKNIIFISTIFSIIFAFSPYVTSLMPPGHFVLLFPYAFFPLILLFFDDFLTSERFEVVVLSKLFFIFFVCAVSFSNVGIIYALVIILGCYAVAQIAIAPKQLVNISTKFFLVICILLLSNIWWLLPYLANIKQQVALNYATNEINGALANDIRDATIGNLFFGINDMMVGYIEPLQIFLLIFFVIALLKVKQKIVYISLFMMIVGLFLTKGPQDPFGSIFFWFYNHFPGFQIFRRPVSKAYWVFFFFFLLISFIGYNDLYKRVKNKKIIIFLNSILSIIAVYCIFLFINAPFINFFTIPQYYFSARDYLMRKNVSNVFIIPTFKGDQPYYDKSTHWYHGDDFLNYIWPFPIIIPDASNNALATQQKRLSLQLMRAIINKKSLCTLTQQLGVSTIMVRQDVNDTVPTDYKSHKLISLLNQNHSDIQRSTFFGKKGSGFTLYTMKKNQCTNNNLLLKNKNAKLTYQMENPVETSFTISNLKNRNEIISLNNFDPEWELYLVNFSLQTNNANKNFVVNNSIFEKNGLAPFQLSGFLLPKQEHSIAFGYANGWVLDPNYIKKNFPSSAYKKNKDGSINIHAIVYYNNQRYLYIGAILEVIVFAIFLFLLLA